jgi:hypothetical protein
MKTIPVEIWEKVAQYGDVKSYYNLRSCSRMSGLGLIPQLTFLSYKEALIELKWKNQKKIQIVSVPTTTMVHELIVSEDIECCKLLCFPALDCTLLQFHDWEFVTVDVEYFRLFLCSPHASKLVNNRLLQVCCQKGMVWAVQLLLQFEIIDPNQCILYALELGQRDILDLLVSDPRVTNLNDLFCEAVEMNMIPLVQKVLQLGKCDPQTNDNYGITIACMMGYDRIVEMLLREDKIDPCSQEQLCIRTACERGHHQIVKMLLDDCRIDPSSRNQECIRVACKYGHEKVVELLMRDGRVDPSILDNIPIREAMIRGHEKVVLLLQKDSRVVLPIDVYIPAFNVM